jgi:hypothetical protein
VLVVLIISLPAEHPGSVPFLGSERSQPVRAGSFRYWDVGPEVYPLWYYYHNVCLGGSNVCLHSLLASEEDNNNYCFLLKA